MDLQRSLDALDRRQQASHWLAIPFAVLKKFADDSAGGLAALVAYYAFVSLFPLLLVLVTILGFVLSGNPSAQHAVETSVLSRIPVIGQEIKVNKLMGSGSALVIGVLISLWGGLGITQAAQRAFDRVWAVPLKDRPDFLRSRLRGLLLLGALGLLFIISTALSGFVTALGGPGVKVAGFAISLTVNFLVILAGFRFLTSNTIPTRQLWIGVGFAALFWLILQVVGSIYISHVYQHASNTYGTFGLVLALIVWLHLGAMVTVYAAEINVVLTRRLWPRSLFGPPVVAADEETLRALAKVEERSDRERIEVQFRD